MSRRLQTRTTAERASDSPFWGPLAAAIGIFVATLIPLIWLSATPLTQLWVVGLLGLAALLPFALWLAVVLHFDGWTPRPWTVVMLALAWGSLVATFAALFLQSVSVLILDRLGVPGLRPTVIGPLLEEITKGLFIVLLYVFVKRHIRGSWGGLVYGVLVGTGFSFVENLANLMGNRGDPSGLVIAYLRDVITSHNHPIFTAATGVAAGMAARQGLPAARAFRWTLCGLLIAWALHAVFNSALDLVPFTVWIWLIPIYAVMFVIVLYQMRRNARRGPDNQRTCSG